METSSVTRHGDANLIKEMGERVRRLVRETTDYASLRHNPPPCGQHDRAASKYKARRAGTMDGKKLKLSCWCAVTIC